MGSANSNVVQINVLAPCATPTLTPPPGSYSGAQSVVLACSTPGSSIFYTTNGVPPTPSSTLYTGAINVSSNETILCIATASGFAQSAQAGGPYVISIVPTVTLALTNTMLNSGGLTNRVVLTWNNIGAPAANYRILRQINGGGFSTLTTVAVPGATFTDGGLSSGWTQGQRDYQIQVLDAGNNVIETTNVSSSFWFTDLTGNVSTGPFGVGNSNGWATSDSVNFPAVTNPCGGSPNPAAPVFKAAAQGMFCFIQNAGVNTNNVYMKGTLAQNFITAFQFWDTTAALETYLSAAATFDTASHPGYSLWSWSATRNFPFSGTTQVSLY